MSYTSRAQSSCLHGFVVHPLERFSFGSGSAGTGKAPFRMNLQTKLREKFLVRYIYKYIYLNHP